MKRVYADFMIRQHLFVLRLGRISLSGLSILARIQHEKTEGRRQKADCKKRGQQASKLVSTFLLPKPPTAAAACLVASAC